MVGAFAGEKKIKVEGKENDQREPIQRVEKGVRWQQNKKRRKMKAM